MRCPACDLQSWKCSGTQEKWNVLICLDGHHVTMVSRYPGVEGTPSLIAHSQCQQEASLREWEKATKVCTEQAENWWHKRLFLQCFCFSSKNFNFNWHCPLFAPLAINMMNNNSECKFMLSLIDFGLGVCLWMARWWLWRGLLDFHLFLLLFHHFCHELNFGLAF